MKFKAALLATALAAGTQISTNAQSLGTPGDGITPRSQAEMMMGPYVSLGGGVNWAQGSEVFFPNAGFSLDGDLGFRTGWTGNGAIGYAFGFGPRVELEVSYRHNEALSTFHGGCSVSDNTKIKQLGLMANVAYDFFTGTRLVPYIGGGIGAVQTKFHFENCEADFIDDKQWVLAVQVFGGADFLITDALRLGLRYTFLHTNDLTEMRNDGPFPPGLYDMDFDPNNHAVTLQLAYNFGAPRQIALPPAPVAAPPPPMQRNFLVFFDFDKSDITSEADRVIVQAANNAKSAAVTRITLTGHTDRSGPVAYNQRLSERRADAVKARLVREGVPAASIVTIGRGESQPLVPTADGVREPQNRRVEIVL
jgi:outer membrane protein OmpA-like peptidoglycan-associated protein